MSANVPKKLSKQDYNKLNNYLKDNELPKYSDLIKRKYKKPKDEKDYFLEESNEQTELIQLQYVFTRFGKKQFDNLEEISQYLKMLSENKRFILLFAYNGTGKTRLSVEFKNLGQTLDEETGEKITDTLYYNAYTEDLFYWDNDLKNDMRPCIRLNSSSRFFSGLKELEMESRIRRFLHRYADFNFTISYDKYEVSFFRDVTIDGVSQRVDNIKVSRGEENLFIWCFFLAIVQLVVDKEGSYDWVKYIYIDDPVSSLDDNNVITMAYDLASLLSDIDIKVIVSSHHTLFYNVMCNEIRNPEQLFFKKIKEDGTYILKDTSKTPFFYHVAMLQELKKAADSGELYTYHFNILRSIMEKTATFHGYRDFSACLRKGEDENSIVYKRIINLLNYGNYSIYEPREMVEDNKKYFRTILNEFLEDYKFNQNIFKTEETQEDIQ